MQLKSYLCKKKTIKSGMKKMTYNEAYSRLQEILSQIESNQLDVDQLSEKLKETSELLKLCKEKLFVANEETKKILEKME